MELALPPGIDRLPRHHARLEAICSAALDDDRILGIGVGGSFAAGHPDEYSDLDLQLAVDDGRVGDVGRDLPDLAGRAGGVVASFTAEHVGFPNMLIVLYEDLLHVDLEPIAASDIGARNAGLATHVVWEREAAISSRLGVQAQDDAAAQLRWFEHRMWTWCWYVQSKILRGELYEAIEGLQYLRNNVLFPLVARRRGDRPSGSRRVESILDELEGRFRETVPRHDADEALSALRASMSLYLELADPLLEGHGIDRLEDARELVLRALELGRDWEPSRGETR